MTKPLLRTKPAFVENRVFHIVVHINEKWLSSCGSHWRSADEQWSCQLDDIFAQQEGVTYFISSILINPCISSILFKMSACSLKQRTLTHFHTFRSTTVYYGIEPTTQWSQMCFRKYSPHYQTTITISLDCWWKAWLGPRVNAAMLLMPKFWIHHLQAHKKSRCIRPFCVFHVVNCPVLVSLCPL